MHTDIELATPESRAKTLPLGHQFTLNTNDAKFSYGKCATTWPDVSWRYVWSLQRRWSPPGPRLLKSVLRIHAGLTLWTGNRFYIWIEELYNINWITRTRKSGKHFHATYGTLDRSFDLIRSHTVISTNGLHPVNSLTSMINMQYLLLIH